MSTSHDPELSSPTVVVDRVTKKYAVRNRHAGGRLSALRGGGSTTVRALRGVSFASFPGENIGVLGHNGSGKSTLMKMISGGESPTSGTILTRSQPTLLSINAALQTKLSGDVNIRLGLLAAGIHPKELEAMRAEIVEFADLGSALDRPMETYSSGMDARLRFGIATAINRDILLIDEALSVGDAAFQDRAKERMTDLLSNSGTVFIVSHSAATIELNCTRAIWLHQGAIIADGEAKEVAVAYRDWALARRDGDTDLADRLINRATANYQRPEFCYTLEDHKHGLFT